MLLLAKLIPSIHVCSYVVSVTASRMKLARPDHQVSPPLVFRGGSDLKRDSIVPILISALGWDRTPHNDGSTESLESGARGCQAWARSARSSVAAVATTSGVMWGRESPWSHAFASVWVNISIVILREWHGTCEIHHHKKNDHAIRPP